MINNKKLIIAVLLFVFVSFPLLSIKAETTTDNFLIFRRGNGSGNITVQKDGNLILNCGNNCTTKISQDTTLTLQAEANDNSTFEGWSFNEDNTNKASQITSANTNLDLVSSETTIVYAKFSLKSLPGNTSVLPEDRDVPRVMFWPGKVNQHWDLENNTWTTDSDGFSGSRENKLEYCKKFYPETIKVVAYKEEQTNTWKDAGNLNNYLSTKQSYRCVLEGENIAGEDLSNAVSEPGKGSICYYFPENPLCVPLSDPRAIRSALSLKIENFVSNGVDDDTIKLGSGERAAVLKSYETAFNKTPNTEEDYEDLIRISHGQWPNQTSQEAEKNAFEEFQKIYKRIPNLDNKNDEAAITVMAYGLRQKAENRNLASESAALKTFKSIYKRMPASTFDWNILQGITYSGATRELDSDGDLLSDRREKELGTDPHNPDTDGDGYFDGTEVANGYSPLK